MSIERLGGTPSPDISAARRRPIGHDHFWERALTRRSLFRTAAGAAGAVASWSALRPVSAWGLNGDNDPKPIPGGMVVGDEGWHVFQPGHSVPVDSTSPINEPSTITDFAGSVAIMQVQGTGTGRQGGLVFPLAYDTDMRFMQGTYVARNGRKYKGTFGFICLDLYAGGMIEPGVPQLHNYNPGIAPSGLFWTIRIPDNAVASSVRNGIAYYGLDDVPLRDSYNLANALAGGPSEPAVASFVVRWESMGDWKRQRDVTNRFVLAYREALSTVSWSAQGSGFSFSSDDKALSTSVFALLGQERNGVFFR